MNRAEFIFVKQIRIHILHIDGLSQIDKNNVKKQDVKMFEMSQIFVDSPTQMHLRYLLNYKNGVKMFYLYNVLVS